MTVAEAFVLASSGAVVVVVCCVVLLLPALFLSWLEGRRN